MVAPDGSRAGPRVSAIDVLVAGAGPTGLTLALQAHDHGARVRVVERRAEPFRPSRALIVHPRTLEVLRPLGVTERLLDRGDAAPAVQVHLGDRVVPVRLGEFALADTPYPHLLFERQADVEAVLNEALADRGVEVERGVELVGADRDDGGGDGAQATLRRGSTVESVGCRFVAGCDGAASTVRHFVGAAWRGRPYRQEVVLADVALDGTLEPGVAHVVAGRRGLLFVFALGEGAPWRILATRRTRPDPPPPPGQPEEPVPAEELQDLLDDAGLPARVAEVAWSGRVPLQHRVASRYRRGPLFLAGDAAHVHSPAGGQGMNTGIQDAVNLGWKLASAASGGASQPELLLDSYEVERRPVARHVVSLTNGMFWGEAATSPLPSFARAVLAPLTAPLIPHVLGARALVARVIRCVSQLDVHYRHSPLSVEGTPRGRGVARPGERLPDGPVTVAGRRLRLHDLVARPGFHVLLERGAPAAASPPDGPRLHVHRLENWPGAGVVIVRPDGYVGFRAGAADAHQVARWLSLAGTAATTRGPVSR